MKAVKFPQANKILTAPAGKEKEVYDLHVCQTEDSNGQTVVISCFELDDDDLINLNLNRKLYLSFHGTTHPPVAIYCEDPWKE